MNDNEENRFMLVGLYPKSTNNETIVSDLEELQLLVNTYGGQVNAATFQKADHKTRETYIGKGKAQETADKIADEKINVVVLNDKLKPGQIFTLEKIFERSNNKIKVWDRMDLILNIFKQHAHTNEANLQIKLASLRHMGPKLYGMGHILSRQAGGIGTRGIGETNTEIVKRHWKNEIRTIRLKLEKLVADRQRQIDRRQKQGLFTVSIIGYTNAGKTALFNKLTGKKKLVENQLFATLDSTTGKLYLPSLKRNIIVSDTIGFIKNLPLSLIDSFKSTLMESANADILLHVIDILDKNLEGKVNVVENLLKEMNIDDKKQIYVFNKIDQKSSFSQKQLKSRYYIRTPMFISAKKGRGLDLLVQTLDKYFLQQISSN